VPLGSVARRFVRNGDLYCYLSGQTARINFCSGMRVELLPRQASGSPLAPLISGNGRSVHGSPSTVANFKQNDPSLVVRFVSVFLFEWVNQFGVFFTDQIPSPGDRMRGLPQNWGPYVVVVVLQVNISSLVCGWDSRTLLQCSPNIAIHPEAPCK
jgi:hypothetical protein